MILSLQLEDSEIVEQIWSLQHTAYRLEAEAVGLTEYPPLPDTFDSIRSSGDEFYGEVSEDGDLRGAIGVRQELPGTLEITRLMVHPAWLRRGIGSSLLQHVLASNPNFGAFTVTASSLNAPAVALYRRYRFRPVKTVNSAAGVELTLFRLER
ncbi:GNAT family N-acetyltransferase [Paenibacillus macerans]|uniref:GNAT family N-acetyltransferase n=1 Tax=Paenibacillus macerans TaxID=44252 RepID=UPI003D319481